MGGKGLRLLALLFAFALVAAACGDSDDSDADAGATTTAADDSTETTEAPAETTEAPADDDSAETTEAPADDEGAAPSGEAPASIEEWEALWATEREVIVEEIVANGWGVNDENVLVGPAGFEIDLNNCPADWDPTEGVTDTEIRVGLSTAQSGNLAAYGDIGVGWNAQLEYVNENGGIDGRTFTMVIRDDAYVASQTIEVVDELIQNENVFTITTLGSPNTLATYDTLNDNCIPQPFVQTAHPAWGDPVNHPWTWGLQLAYTTEAGMWATWIDENMADQAPVKVAGLVMDNDFGLAYEEGFREGAEESDVIGDFVAIRHDPAAPTVTNEITTIAGEEPDVFILMTAGNPCLLGIQDAGRAGLTDAVDVKFSNQTCKPIESIMGPGGEASDGYLIFGGGIKVNTDPQFADEPFISWMNDQLDSRGLDHTVDLYAAGFGLYAWPYEQAMRIAAELPDGLTRPNFVLAARSMQSMTNPILLDGISFGVYGNDDAYYIEGSEIARFDAADQAWVQEGDVIDLNGESGACAWNVDEGGCE